MNTLMKYVGAATLAVSLTQTGTQGHTRDSISDAAARGTGAGTGAVAARSCIQSPASPEYTSCD